MGALTLLCQHYFTLFVNRINLDTSGHFLTREGF